MVLNTNATDTHNSMSELQKVLFFGDTVETGFFENGN